MKDEFYFPSKDGNTEIHTIEWKPEGQVKAVLQLSHGMVEYVDRYSEFAEYLCEKGFYVVGNDHLGHGKSVQSKSEYGFFNEKYGNACVLGDLHTLRQRTMKKYPDVPYFMLGHSMGSSLLRQYIQMYGNGLSGAIIMGTMSEQNKTELKIGKDLCRILAVLKGWHYRSKLVDKMVNGPFCKKFKPARTRADWVTSDTGSVCFRSAVFVCIYSKCLLSDVLRNSADAEAGKHLHDTEDAADFYGVWFGRSGRRIRQRCQKDL